ncbi:hypothetical protein O6H91_17G060900 [Diphasiastrum complanatum]|uniref:Uncharacterized protein n=1 Tax=Diphasiastrum complanatum TaxID=34168 RepID=A0ACC2B795_DIPCM|nr:hypothetical protein O6H91_17G060900 [Diphasiastrum complanatum]
MAFNRKGTGQNITDIVLDGSTSFTISPIHLGANVDCFEKKSKAFVATELRSDLIVEVGNVRFHLQKFPLLSRSDRLNRFVFESRTTEQYHIRLHDSPGGSEAFDLAARFCYGMDVDLNASNVASARCIAEYLEMTDDLEEGNLLSKTEAFLANFVFPSWTNSMKVLQSCQNLCPWAENLKIVQRCCESIAWKACTDPQGIKSPSSKIIKTIRNRTYETVKQDYWFEDLAVLHTGYFVRVITAMRVKGIKPELLGAAITHYALKHLNGVLKEQGSSNYLLKQGKDIEDDNELHCMASDKQFSYLEKHELELLRGIVSILPYEENAVTNKFLSQLIWAANKLNADSACKRDLEKRFGWQLEYATLNDLLVPAFDCEYDTFFDVELVQRLVEFFLLKENTEQISSSPSLYFEQLSLVESPKSLKAKQATWMKVVKLLDSYLSEIAKNKNLSLTRFQAFAQLMPENARLSHDGLYRAIDVFLKTHPSLSEQERKKLCKIMDCRKLSPEACVHAVQNERLSVRIVVQILLGEHLKVRNALAISAKEPTEFAHDHSKRYNTLHETHFEDVHVQSDGWGVVQQEMKSMRSELDKLKARFSEFLSEYRTFQQEMHNLAKQNILLSWMGGWRKFKLSRFYFHLSSRERDKGDAKGDGSSPAKQIEQWKQRNRRHSLS